MDIATGIEGTERKDLAESLAHLLADTYTLYLKTHGFHWNVTGPAFSQLHAMFEEQYRELAEAVDAIAERIRALGYPAPGSYEEFSRLSSIPQDAAVQRAPDMVADLQAGHEALTRTIRDFTRLAEQASDHATADLLAERMRVHEQTAWMLRSTLAAD